MARINDAISCALAVVLIVLGTHEAKPLVAAFHGDAGRLNAQALVRAARNDPPFAGADRVTVLLIGADQRAGDAGRSDTLLLLFLNPQTHRTALLGIPRDLRVRVPGHGRTKINHAYAYGGPGLARRTVEGLLDVRIDHHAVMFLDGFVRAVDALGGVTLDVPDVEGQGRGMNYDDDAGNLHIHLKPGPQHLDGYRAMGFVRYRKSNTPGLGDGDLNRSSRQQQFLQAIADQHIRPSSLPGLLAGARVAAEHVRTDLTPPEVIDLTRVLHDCDSGGMLTCTVPVSGSSAGRGGPYYAYADEGGLAATLAEIDRHLAG